MARPIEFNTDEAIEAAMQTFWSKGPRTSLSELEAGTRLSRSSLYNSFGKKDDIFSLCIERYMWFLHEKLRKAFEDRPFQESLAFLIEDAVGDNFGGRGCFFYNCLREANQLNHRNQQVIAKAYQDLHDAISDHVQSAKEQQKIDADISVSGYTTCVMALLAGFRSFNLAGMPKEHLSMASSVAQAKFCSKN